MFNIENASNLITLLHTAYIQTRVARVCKYCSFIKNYADINILEAIIATQTNLLYNKTLVFIKAISHANRLSKMLLVRTQASFFSRLFIKNYTVQ